MSMDEASPQLLGSLLPSSATPAKHCHEKPHILVVDDEQSILEALSLLLNKHDFAVTTTNDGQEALQILKRHNIDVMLSDIHMPNMNGIVLLQASKAIAPTLEIVMMTAYGSIEYAVECMKQGAYDFISKPLKKDTVLPCIKRALEKKALLVENQHLKQTIAAEDHGLLIGQSPAMQKLLQVIQQVAKSDATVLLTGQSGTGKECVAQAIHRASLRHSQPFVAVNCAAIPENLLESELFGHEKGAFTGALQKHLGRFERAHHSSLFLDEIAETTAALQLRLLRVLQEGEIERLGGNQAIAVDVRIIAATNQNIQEAVAEKRFREDLYYRLNVIHIALPTLQQRCEDILLLAQHFLKKYAGKNKKPIYQFTAQSKSILENYSWPGNVRELENAIERAVVLCEGERITSEDLPPHLQQPAKAFKHHREQQSSEPSITFDLQDINPEPCPLQDAQETGIWIPFGLPLHCVKDQVIRRTMQHVGGNKKAAASLLGIASRTIHRQIHQIPKTQLSVDKH